MPDLPQISEAEFEVMKIVWKYAPINTNEITERLLNEYYGAAEPPVRCGESHLS
ncbi:MAG: BlaI/MecI/CopY family transcriptional regulator, partial [Mediterraneibacter sp.]